MLTAIAIVVVVLLVLIGTTLASSVRVLREYERGVVFRLGRLMELRGPGLQLLLPSLDRMVRVSLRTVTLTVPPQEIITRDNVPARVTAVAYYRVIDPSKAITEVESFQSATLQIAQTTLRSVLGVADLDTLLSEREHLNESLAQVIDTQTEPWGIKVTMVEIKDVEIPERMQHAIARQAEAERERRAKIINAEGEFQSAAKLAEAADVMSANPVTLQLRYLQTLREIGGQQNSTIVFPMPIDLMRPMLDALGKVVPAEQVQGQGASDPGAAALNRAPARELSAGSDDLAAGGQLGAGSDLEAGGQLSAADELGAGSELTAGELSTGSVLGAGNEALPSSMVERNGQTAETPRSPDVRS